jgi:hypothetical protein
MSEKVERDHERIWLQAEQDADPDMGRMWCQDKVWPDPENGLEGEPTEYRLAADYDLLKAENDRLAAENERLRAGDTRKACKHCKGVGFVADYVGEDMRPIETGCPYCKGTGRAALKPKEANDGDA